VLPGDGRELVISDANAVKIRAEDGRYIDHVNISPFIDNLPYDKPTTAFSSCDASGSTSQASNIQEALEVGCSTLLIDEDTCATNFMIRDERMQALISPDKEPITPFILKVRSIFSSLGASSVLVIGGCGEYFGVADQVIMMDAFVPHDVTDRAKAIAVQFATAATSISSSGVSSLAVNSEGYFPSPTDRFVSNILSANQRDVKIAVRNRSLIQIGDLDLNLTCVEQICDPSQTRSIADILVYLSQRIGGTTPQKQTLSLLLDQLEQAFDSPTGLDVLFPPDRLRGNCARPRRFEIAAAINRLRSATFSQTS
jgi:predicted ABC-class ATPase